MKYALAMNSAKHAETVGLNHIKCPLKGAADKASAAWREAATGTPDEKKERARLRAVWTAARDKYLAQRKKLQRTTGPATMVSIKATLSSALSDAVKEELIAKNYAAFLTLPKATRPRALAWTAPRVARWKRTGEKPPPVMVWTLQQTAEFLDFIVADRHFPIGTVSEQLVSISHEVHEDDPKADSVRDIKLNRDSVMLLKAWRKKQTAERKKWAKAGVPPKSGNRVFAKEDGSAYHPQYFTDRWDRLVELSGLPPIRLHDGRHEAASLAPAAGVAPKAVQPRPRPRTGPRLAPSSHFQDRLGQRFRPQSDQGKHEGPGQKLWPDPSSWSPLSDSNRRPTHYKCVALAI
jgi:hypothetical protein